jgi:WD40 repeat protein
VYNGHKDRVDALAWSPSGQLIASASYDNTVQVWRASGGGLVYTYNHHHDAVYDVLWSPDGSLIASCGADKTAQVWQAPTG